MSLGSLLHRDQCKEEHNRVSSNLINQPFPKGAQRASKSGYELRDQVPSTKQPKKQIDKASHTSYKNGMYQQYKN